jgi:hypothetical protein
MKSEGPPIWWGVFAFLLWLPPKDPGVTGFEGPMRSVRPCLIVSLVPFGLTA